MELSTYEGPSRVVGSQILSPGMLLVGQHTLKSGRKIPEVREKEKERENKGNCHKYFHPGS